MKTTSPTILTDLVEQVSSLPSVATQVVSLASDPDCEINCMTKVIMSDGAMTMRFLALANSSAFSFGHEIKDLRTAIIRLGLVRVRNIALLMGIHDIVEVEGNTSDLDMTGFWQYTLATASCCKALAWLRSLPQGEESAWLAGILHGLGIAAFNQNAGPEFQQALALAQAEKIPLAQAEMRIFKYHHGDLGARLLRKWNLPSIFVEAVEAFPDSEADGEITADVLPLVRVLRDASLTARAIGFCDNGDGDSLPDADMLPELLDLADEALNAIALKVDSEVGEVSGLIGLDMPEDAFAEALAASRCAAAHLGLAGFDDGLVREGLERQLASAREIQQRLLPEVVPNLAGFDLAAANLPSLQVSGDTYDFVKLRDGRLAFFICDVSGKGMAAALLASTIQASLRSLARVFNDPGELLATVNEELYETTDPEMFATIFMAAVASDGESLQYSSAGHSPPLLLRYDQSVEWLMPASTPVGVLSGMAYPVQEIPFNSGDLLVAYTDGITEAFDQNDEEFGEAELEKVAKASRESLSRAVITNVLAAVREHVQGHQGLVPELGLPDWSEADEDLLDAGDDLTLVVLRKNL